MVIGPHTGSDHASPAVEHYKCVDEKNVPKYC